MSNWLLIPIFQKLATNRIYNVFYCSDIHSDVGSQSLRSDKRFT